MRLEYYFVVLSTEMSALLVLSSSKGAPYSKNNPVHPLNPKNPVLKLRCAHSSKNNPAHPLNPKNPVLN